MTVHTQVYKVEALVRRDRGRPIRHIQDGNQLTLDQARDLAKTLLADLQASHPDWTRAETIIHYNTFVTR